MFENECGGLEIKEAEVCLFLQTNEGKKQIFARASGIMNLLYICSLNLGKLKQTLLLYPLATQLI
jgi:hypothetical protein